MSQRALGGQFDEVDPKTLHPNMHDYPSGIGNVGGTESTVGYVPTKILAGMPGNWTDRYGIDKWTSRLQSGEGFEDPIMVEFNPSERIARVGEGNHRVEAARRLGITHLPTRVVRSNIDAEYTAKNGGEVGRVETTSPWRDGRGGEYWPPMMHPKYLWPQDTL